MGRHQNWPTTLRRRFKTAVKKLNFVLNFLKESSKWRRLASICGGVATLSGRRRWSFNDRHVVGLQHCIDDDYQQESDESSSVRALQRTTSYVNYSSDDDIDRRAEIFISNFRRRLLYERQVSLQLRYDRRNSFN
ncbi:hypothetical protein ACOSP7_007929 [Xanthoceras sorbifolium]